MSILIGNKENYKIELAIGCSTGQPRKFVACKSDDKETIASWEGKFQHSINSFTFRPTDLEISTKIYSNCVDVTEKGIKPNIALLRYNRLIYTLVDWDIQDESGNKIEVTHKNIGSLPEAVSSALSDIIDSSNL